MKPGAWPIIIANNVDKLWIRWCASRALFAELAKAGAADDVVYMDGPALLLEVSLHDTAADAQAEADKINVATREMLNGPRGSA